MRPIPLATIIRTTALIAITLLTLGKVPGAESAPADAVPPRGYHIGNSLTNGVISLPGFNAYLGDLGHPYVCGYHILWGASLSMLVQKQDAPSRVGEPFGPYPKALAGGHWDVLTLQPSFAVMEGPQGDLAQATALITQAQAQSPDVQVYIYETWPTVGDKAPPGTYARMWNRPYTPGAWGGALYSGDYCTKLVEALRAEHLPGKPVLLLPVGAVLARLDQEARAGHVPGVTSVESLYRDGTHLETIGNVVAMCTWRCVLRQCNPQGVNRSLLPPDITPALATAIEGMVWATVSEMPLTGIQPLRGGGAH